VGRILRLVIALALAAAALAGPAGAAPPPDAGRTGGPWATVNVCDTAGHPDGVGVRGWMPGARRMPRLQMRIRIQFRRKGAWVAVKGADSGWIDAGGAGQRAGEAGRTFTVTPPRAGRAFILRGVVLFRWRDAEGRVRRGARRATRGGHPGTAGADPRDFSAATCTVR
jgi:hypothetical protein